MKIKKFIISYLPTILVSTLLVTGLIYAWTEPLEAPPSGNLAAPINVSTNPQSKIGDFGLGGGSGQPLYWLKNIGGTLYFSATDPAGDRVTIGQDGKVGIGTTDPKLPFQLNTRIGLSQDNNNLNLVNNAYRDAEGTWRYITSDEAALFQINNDGTFYFYKAVSGIADNPITWLTAGPSGDKIIIRRYNGVWRHGWFDINTWVSSASHYCTTGSFYAQDGDIDENHADTIIALWAYQKGATWWVTGDFHSHNNGEEWKFDVICYPYSMIDYAGGL